MLGVSKFGHLLLSFTTTIGIDLPTTLTLCLLFSLYSSMTKKRMREHSTSPKFHRVTWAEKRTRRGTVISAKVVTTPGSLQTPVKAKKHTSLHNTKYSQDQTPTAGEGIKVAMSLPPIPALEILASKKGRTGKV